MLDAPAKPPLILTGPAKEAYERVSGVISPADGMFQGNIGHYFSCGASALNVISAAIGLAGMADVKSILDFGSGAGRVTRWLRAAFPNAELSVTDIREGDLAFCATEFAASTWASGIAIDELSAPRTYDVIWVGSVVTHLSYQSTTRMVWKLLSFLAPKGLLIVSMHGRFAHSNGAGGKNYGIVDGWAEVEQGYLGPAGYGYVDYPNQTGYGISLTKPSWTAGLVEAMPEHRLVLFSERAWDGHHDVVAIQNAPVTDKAV